MSEISQHSIVEIGSERSFGLVFAAVFCVIGLWPLFGDGAVRVWAIAVAAGFLFVALVAPRKLRRLNRIWFMFGMWLGKIVAPVVMMLVFFVAVMPTGFALRALGKDPLRRKFEPEAESYWVIRDRDNNPMGSMKNQF